MTDIGWYSIQRRLQGDVAADYTHGHFTFLGDPQLHGDAFAVNVFNMRVACIEVLRGDRELARQCMTAHFMHGPLGVFKFTVDDDVEHVGQLAAPIQPLALCDLNEST